MGEDDDTEPVKIDPPEDPDGVPINMGEGEPDTTADEAAEESE